MYIINNVSSNSIISNIIANIANKRELSIDQVESMIWSMIEENDSHCFFSEITLDCSNRIKPELAQRHISSNLIHYTGFSALERTDKSRLKLFL